MAQGCSPWLLTTSTATDTFNMASKAYLGIPYCPGLALTISPVASPCLGLLCAICPLVLLPLLPKACANSLKLSQP